ncbi:MAG: signal peptide peptidase SppA [Nitrospirae bacterium]|nr:signal peptide peptidase SppA [Nitrospirota bacterium]
MKKIVLLAIMLMLLPGMNGCTFLKVNIGEEVQPLTEKAIAGKGRDKVLVLDISGIIMGGETGSPLSGRKKPGLIARVREALDRARQDTQVKAVVLRVNSPGGGVTASDILYHELKTFKQETGVTLVAHIMDVGASGAYYAALAADAITAQPTSVTGSIGVIMYRVDATGLMQKVGIQTVEIVSADKKGIGSPFRPLSDDERKIFQGFIDSLYGRFTGLVAEERRMTPDAVKKVADGRIFTSREAQAGGLIDGIGYLEDAIELAKKKAGLPEARVVTYFRPGEYRDNIYSMNLINIDLGDLADPGAKFLYLWWP